MAHDNRFLILDDDSETGRTVQLMVEALGMEARVTTVPGEFFAQIEAWQPSHVVLDLIMPEMDGVQVMAALARSRCRAQIIIISGVGSRVLDAARRSASAHGLNIAGILSKPFSSAALRNLVLGSRTPVSASDVSLLDRGGRSLDEVTREELSDALSKKQLYVVYQPMVDCQTGVLTGFEALTRWHHPERGLISPEAFIPLAEASDDINRLTEQVVRQGLAWFSRFRNRIHDPGGGGCSTAAAESLTLSINLSARTLQDHRFVDQVIDLCTAYGVASSNLTFELTETSAMEDPVGSLDLLTRMRMKGFQLSLDDFGTGYSSMVQLVRLPFSEIKVDKSFVMTALHSQESCAVVKSIVELGHSLGLRTIAEGVEDKNTLDFLRSVGCHLAQGYLIGRPMRGEDVDEWYRTWAGQHVIFS